jgi:hypothetical protein
MSESVRKSEKKFIERGGLILKQVRISPEVAPLFEEICAKSSEKSRGKVLDEMILNYYNRFVL